MAADSFTTQDTANQVGGSFVTQYYNMLHEHPDEVYQFYKNNSKITRIDGNITLTSSGILDIHSVISSLKFTSIEIKTANFQTSIQGGIIIMVTGFVQSGQYEKRRKFIQLFFLATQETGYLILNDLFHYVDEEYFCTPALLAQGNYESGSVPVLETVSDPNDFTNGDSNYDFSYQEQQTLNSSFSNINLSSSQTLNSSFSNLNNISSQSDMNNNISSQVPIPPTYASILKSRVTETESPVQKSSQIIIQNSIASSNTSISDKSSLENDTTLDSEVESKSVYVKNVGWHLNETDLYNVFKQYGKLAPDPIAIRSNKLMQESGKYYAFVEYEDIEGVQNALMASPINISGWNVYVEERKRSNNSLSYRGRGRGIGGRIGGKGRGNGFE